MSLFEHMRTFVHIVETQSISAAARAQRMSVAAVSRQLRALERDVGAPLLIRTTRRIHVTDAGAQWLESSRQILRDVEEARARARSSASGVLTVSSGITFGMHFVTPRLPRITANNPSLVIDLRLDDNLVQLAPDGIDIAIRGGIDPPDSAPIIADKLLTFERWAVASPAYLTKNSAPKQPDELVKHTCLLHSGAHPARVRWRFQKGGDSALVDVTGPLRCTTPVAVRELAIAGMGCALLPEWLVSEDVARGRLRRILPTWSNGPVNIWALYRTEDRRSQRVRTFVDGLR